MEEIKVGEYVRITHMYHETKIARITKVLEKDPYYKNMQMYGIDVVHQYSNGHFPAFKIYKEDIVKHSSNIIDLIEVGDYVNGKEVVYDVYDTDTIDKHKCIEVSISNDNSATWIVADIEIKSIVTKEQFAAVEYKLDN